MKKWLLFGFIGLIIAGSISSWLTERQLKNTDDPVEITLLTLNEDKVKARYVTHTKALFVDHIPTENWSSKSMVKTWHWDIMKLTPTVFNNAPDADKIIYNLSTDLVDVKGNSKSKRVASATFYRKTASTINWESFDQANMRQIADSYYMHIAIKRDLASSN